MIDKSGKKFRDADVLGGGGGGGGGGGLQIWTRADKGEGVKKRKFLRTSYIDAPYAKCQLTRVMDAQQ
jgi:hypothetical protein